MTIPIKTQAEMDSMLMTMLRNALMQVELMDERTTDVQDTRRAGRIAGIAAIGIFSFFAFLYNKSTVNGITQLRQPPGGTSNDGRGDHK